MSTVDLAENSDPWSRLRVWFTGVPGRLLAQSEQAVLARILPDLFGYHLIQLGRLNPPAMTASRISHKMVAAIDLAHVSGDEPIEGVALACSAGALPITGDSVDVVLLPHVLEFEDNPHQVLREVERILIGEGHIVVVGFNPFSLFGLWRILLWWKEQPPWSGGFLSAARLKDWLKLLGFDNVSTSFLFYRPPSRHPGLLARVKFLEKVGSFCWRYCGGVYVLVGKKRIENLTPIRTQWTRRRHLISTGLTEPTTRSDGRQASR